MSFDYHVRRKETALDAGIRKSLRGESTSNDQSPNPIDWSVEMIQAKAREAQRIQDEREAGAWPMTPTKGR